MHVSHVEGSGSGSEEAVPPATMTGSRRTDEPDEDEGGGRKCEMRTLKNKNKFETVGPPVPVPVPVPHAVLGALGVLGEGSRVARRGGAPAGVWNWGDVF